MNNNFKKIFWTSSQDGLIGRYTLPPHITKRTTINLKTINNKKCQKIKLYRSPTTKELKKHSSRPVGGAEMGSWGREDWRQGSGWRTSMVVKQQLVKWAVPHLHADKLGGTAGE